MRRRPTSSVSVKALVDQIAARGWRSVLVRTFILAGGWLIICEGDRAALLFGLPVVILALSASLFFPSPPPPKWSAVPLLRYVSTFLVGSLQGGVDVARRVLSPRLPLAPTILRYGLRLRTEPARHLFMGSLNLMPGTLSVSVDGDDLSIHVLFDEGDQLLLRLRNLEEHVAHALGEPLERPHA